VASKSGDTGGCGCRMPAERSGSTTPGGAGGLALALGAFLRRRRQSY
jgi:MYXO-CTERM domain-containing protein